MPPVGLCDGLFTGRTIDVRSSTTVIALNILAAKRTGEFKFSPKCYWPQNMPFEPPIASSFHANRSMALATSAIHHGFAPRKYPEFPKR